MADSDPDLVDELFAGDRAAMAPPTVGRRIRGWVGRVCMVAGGLLALFAVLYAADLMASAGDVPRGVTVSGVPVGGLSRSAAESTLRHELDHLRTEPLTVRAGNVEVRLDPVESGLGLDWAGTVERAGRQPLDPLTRLRSFFGSREVGLVTTVDAQRLRDTLTGLARDRIDRDVIEGDIGFRTDSGGGTVHPFVVEPRPGQRLADVDRAARLVANGWPAAGPVEVPVEVEPPETTPEGVHATLRDTVEPMVSGPVRFRGDGAEAVLAPREIAGALSFRPADGGLAVEVDRSRLRQAVRAELGRTEEPARDANLVFTGSRPEVRAGAPGRRIDWARTFAPFVDVATSRDGRELRVVYDTRRPDVTTAEIERLGIVEVVAEFTTDGMAGAVARNVATIARAVNGVIVRPGETFSLDAHTGPRTRSQGYVRAPVYEDGTGRPVIGGGVSQFTSTLHNAVYLAGLADAGHTEHPYHLDRYPFARDAISLRPDGSSVDYSFTNDTPKGIAIQTRASGSSVTVTLWGTRHYRVDSVTSGRSGFEPPPIVRERGGDCTPSRGEPGFRVSDTRIRYELDSGREVGRQTRQVRYAPRPVVLCVRST
ncbi:vancomycin resistance protein YoaR [Prauserella shujinwangii]|uniref:Vancomycin resistance protein YoaR n=1 Tax=Prauserella shujinwangii TaxID=1453103 RepID=A0A2T0LUV5_9PSEU|nr:VanW family protein [Prauserella shujinwangii]PRX47587.1 vancomycin resistance protein YoaR [Prauserella shujinwangii]